jgi:hypothetical protein
MQTGLVQLVVARSAGALCCMAWWEYRGEPNCVESVAVLQGVEHLTARDSNVGRGGGANGLGVDRKPVLILGGKAQDFSALVDPVARHVLTGC